MRLLFCLLLTAPFAFGQSVEYPHPVQYIQLSLQQRTSIRMAYMDVQPERPNGQTVVLLHGKNFNGFYWKDVIPFLRDSGYRVVVPDQVGWGRSDKPDLHYSFHMLAANTAALLDSLQVDSVFVVGHSMGGMLATRFALLYPERVRGLVLENPIGLEDYRTFVPYVPLDTLWARERSATYASIKKYQQTYYPVWKPEYEPYVVAQAEALQSPDFPQVAWVNALTYQMIYQQPVVYEFDSLRVPTLLVMGQEDRTVVGKNLLPPAEAERRGQYPQLGRSLQERIPGARLMELRGVGHIPHIQDNEIFRKTLLDFLRTARRTAGMANRP